MYIHNRLQTHIDTYEGEHIVTDGKPSVNAKLTNFRLDGKSVQNGIPTPESPVPIESVPSSFDITSCGKNLLDVSKAYNRNSTLTSFVIDDNKIIVTYKQAANYTRVIVPIYLKAGIYTIKNNVELPIGVGFYGALIITPELDSTSHPVKSISPNQTGTFEALVDQLYYVWLYVNLIGSPAENSTITWYDLQIEKGDTATPYTPYQGSTTTLNLVGAPNAPAEWVGQPISLMSLPDGTKDEYNDGKIILRTKKQVFSYPQTGDGADDINKWKVYTPPSPQGYFECAHNVSADKWTETAGYCSAYCNMFTVLNNYNNSVQHTSIGKRTGDSRYRIFVHYTTLGYTSETLPNTSAEATAAFLSWLNNLIQTKGDLVYVLERAPFEIVYEFATPLTIPVIQQPTPKSVYAQPNNIYAGTTPQPTISCGVRKLGNRPYIQAKLKDELGNFLVDENGNNIGGLY